MSSVVGYFQDHAFIVFRGVTLWGDVHSDCGFGKLHWRWGMFSGTFLGVVSVET